jgi:glyoxylase-like metal-dependent hydrolase (beta-lactamase superfamily II)
MSLAALGVARIRAGNPGPLTLSGTNTWIIGHAPAWVIDPGPLLGAHVDAIEAEVRARGGAGGIAVTHDHPDHAEAAEALRERLGGVPIAAARLPGADRRLADGDRFGPLVALAVPGHAPDHLAFVAGGVGFTGDAVLGEGSVFVAADMAAYLEALQRLRGFDLQVLCPGHGPEIWDPEARIDHYLAHRLDRERRLVAALERGVRATGELLDAVWDDVPRELRPVAAWTLRAHLEKLRDEGPLPGDVPGFAGDAPEV